MEPMGKVISSLMGAGQGPAPEKNVSEATS